MGVFFRLLCILAGLILVGYAVLFFIMYYKHNSKEELFWNDYLHDEDE